LLTIHAAKGLEFSTVFLLDLDRSPPYPAADVQRWGKIRALKLRADREMEETPLFQHIKAAHKLEAEEENKRLLYVALTRAKERLWVPMSSKAMRKDNLKYLLTENMGGLPPETATDLTGTGTTQSYDRMPPINRGETDETHVRDRD